MARDFRIYRVSPHKPLIFMFFLACLIGACSSLPTATTTPTPTTQGNKVTIHEFSLPTPNMTAGSIKKGPDGNLWFIEGTNSNSQSSKIGQITPAGTIREFSLPLTNILPVDLTVGPDGNLWYIEFGKIGRMTLTGTIREFPLPQPGYNTGGITAGPDDNLWFTVNDQNGQNGKIGQMVQVLSAYG
jgi:streptogramin lyase